MSNNFCDEQIVMTPTKRSHGHMTITMERVKLKEMENRNIMHIAGGDHTGIVITKDAGLSQCASSQPELYLGFKVMLRSASNNRKEQEDWLLKFWFKVEVPEAERIENAQAFCTELLACETFPKDSIDFIKRNMKLMQLKYPTIQKVEVEMKKLGDNFKEPKVTTRARVQNVSHITHEDVQPQYVEGHVMHENGQPYYVESHIIHEDVQPYYVESHVLNENAPPCHVKNQTLSHVESPAARGKIPPPVESRATHKKNVSPHVERQVKHENVLRHVESPSAYKSVASRAEIPVTRENSVPCHVENPVSIELTAAQEKLLEILEAVYPNSMPVPSIAKSYDCSEEELSHHLSVLETNRFLKRLKNGNYMRVAGNDADTKMVKQLPMLPSSMQPTIAIITAHYCEKLAVDTMIDDRETFVKFKTEGEANVYTLGKIGVHRVVATKLPPIGHARGQMIAAGSTTTRLLGSFGRVEYVFLVGVGGGVAHYTDYTKHVRLGDVVVSSPPDAKRSYIYMYCEQQNNTSSEDFTSFDQLSIKTWCPPSLQLQQIALNLWQKGLANPRVRPWEHFLEQSCKKLQKREASFCRPSSDTDKLYMSLGENNLIEVGHPQPPEGCFDPRTPDMPVLHFGAVGSGRVLMYDDTTRLEFADHHGILAFDTEFDSVVESIFGNRKDNYVFIRGIADYKDGTKKKEWQPFAALAAAAVMKAIICSLEPLD